MTPPRVHAAHASAEGEGRLPVWEPREGVSREGREGPGGTAGPRDQSVAGPPQVAVRVQHHPARAHLLPTLLERLKGFGDVAVVTDPGGSKPSSWRTHRACLEALPEQATHLLCLQDDAWPCEDFAARAHVVIAAHPSRIVCFFLPGFGYLLRRVNLARRNQHPLMEIPVSTFVPLVAVSYPADVARAIPEFADKRRMPISRADDAVVATYVRAHRLGAVAPLPCLVEHLDGEPSVMRMRHGTRAPHRVAAWYAEA
jgi:hypothetical protein